MIVRVNGDLRFIGAVVIFRVKVSCITRQLMVLRNHCTSVLSQLNSGY